MVDRFVNILFFGPLVPWAMWLFGQADVPSGGEIPGLALITAVMWSIGGAIGCRVGGVDYIVRSICWALLLAVGTLWILVPLVDVPAPRGVALGRVTIATLAVGIIDLVLARSFKLWPFENA